VRIFANATVCDEGNLTGIERYALNISKGLCRLDHDVSIFRGRETANDGCTTVVSSFLPVANSVLGSKAYIFRSVWDQTAFRYHLLRHQAELAYFPIPDGMIFPPVPQIVTVHDLHYLHFDTSIPECKEEINSYRRKIYQYKMPHILNRSAAVVAVSESTKKDIITSFGIDPFKIHVIYNGYDDQRFRIIKDTQPVLDHFGLHYGKYFLFVGSILKHKNISRLVQAFSRVVTEAVLVIAGVCKDGDCLAEVKKVAMDLGLSEERLRYLDYVDDEALPYLYNGALAFVLPSLHEGFGVPIIEAMACGTPVITSNCSAMPEIAGDASLLVDPLSVENIANAMRDIIDTPGLAASMRISGLERAKMFKWSYSAGKLYNLCKTVNGS